MGGIRNAVERGASIVDAQRSFVNAGYPVAEVSAAARKASEAGLLASSRNLVKVEEKTEIKTNKIPLPKPTEEKSSKRIFWITGIISLIILVGALLLGIFWSKFF